MAYGARTLVESGFQSLPKLVFAGGALVGDAAGVLNAARLKGTHLSIKTGMLAGEAAVRALVQRPCRGRCGWLGPVGFGRL